MKRLLNNLQVEAQALVVDLVVVLVVLVVEVAGALLLLPDSAAGDSMPSILSMMVFAFLIISRAMLSRTRGLDCPMAPTAVCPACPWWWWWWCLSCRRSWLRARAASWLSANLR